MVLSIFKFTLIPFLLMNTTWIQQEVKRIDIQAYSGKWYVVAAIPASFDKNWNYVTETYIVNAKGNIDIYTTYKKGDQQEEKSVGSKGFPVAGSHNTQWKVQFVWPFKADYLVEEIDHEYTYAVVGHPKKKFLYIMNRTGRINPLQYEQVLDRMVKKGYNVAEIRKIKQGF